MVLDNTIKTGFWPVA